MSYVKQTWADDETGATPITAAKLLHIEDGIAAVTTPPDATPTVKGLSQLAGDLGGTADAPTVVGGTHHTHTASQVSDSTTIGRAIVTAGSAASVRSLTGALLGTGVVEAKTITQAAYDALGGSVDASTLYLIVG